MPFDNTHFIDNIDVINDGVLHILTIGREKIIKGWYKHTFMNANSVCALGALRLVAWIYKCRHIEDSALYYLQEACGYINVPRWNDLSSTSKQDVINAYDKAIAHRRKDLGL